MPRLTDRQQHAEDILNAMMVHLVAKMEDDAYEAGRDTDSSADDSSDNTSSEDDDPIMEALLVSLNDLHKDRYEIPRTNIPKTHQNLRLLLDTHHREFPGIFRSYMRISPDCFDELLRSIQDHPVFHSKSNNSQMPVKEQLAIALYRFGHYGNAASTMKVALWAGVSCGTVRNATIRVMTALCDPRFRAATMQGWSEDAEKELAKSWVEENSCPAWRDGWCMVDGTLVPLFQRPHHFGNTFYDRKSNYSMNVQIINRPDLKIIDYGIGLPGSQHDATAWKETRIPNEHDQLFGPQEFVWADSAYPLKAWCQAPYKEPEKSVPENTNYNYYVSRIRIRSEHCMGYLKGRWSSLRGLRLRIDDPDMHMFATLWIASCIHLHNFAIGHEKQANPQADSFFIQGQRMLERDRQQEATWHQERQEQLVIEEDQYAGVETVELLEGKIKREELKGELFTYLGIS